MIRMVEFVSNVHINVKYAQREGIAKSAGMVTIWREIRILKFRECALSVILAIKINFVRLVGVRKAKYVHLASRVLHSS